VRVFRQQLYSVYVYTLNIMAFISEHAFHKIEKIVAFHDNLMLDVIGCHISLTKAKFTTKMRVSKGCQYALLHVSPLPRPPHPLVNLNEESKRSRQ